VTLTHLHLLLNHVPTVGLGASVALLLAAFLKKSADLRQAGFVALFVLGLLAIPTYLTGSAAQIAVQDRPGVSADVMAAHQDAALLALIAMDITGLAAWFALWRFRRWHETGVLLLALATFALMARAATIGGHLRHPEILAAGAAAPLPGWPRAAAAGAALVLDNPWVWPIAEVFHFVGLCLLFGIVLFVNLRLAGFVTGLAAAEVNRLLPWAMLGLQINIVTGMLFFLAVPAQYTQNSAFVWKMGLMLLAGAALLHPTLGGGDPNEGARTPALGKVVALGSIGLWVAVIFFGRFLPYIGSE
jgi:hypothetical protein